MEQPQTYLFRNFSSSQEFVNGEHLYRVFIYPSKIVIRISQLTNSINSDILREIVSKERTINLRENSHGQKYITFTQLDYSDNNPIERDVSLTFDLFRFIHLHRGEALTSANTEYGTLVCETICEWFNIPYGKYNLKSISCQLRFPAMKNVENNAKFLEELHPLLSSNPNILSILRESKDWLTFLKTISPSERTDEDFKLLRDYPTCLFWYACETGISMEHMFDWDDTFTSLTALYTAHDLVYLRAMLQHLPKEQRRDATHLILNLAALHEQYYLYADTMLSSSFQEYYPLADIGIEHMPELATMFAKALEEDFKELNSQYKLVRGNKELGGKAVISVRVGTSLTRVLSHWVAVNITESKLESTTTLEDITARFQELFNCSIKEKAEAIQFYQTQAGTNFGYFPYSTYWDDPDEKFPTDLFFASYVICKTGGNLPVEAGIANSAIRGFIDEDGSFVQLSGCMYSLDALLMILEESVQQVDVKLKMLGRAVTPENRVAYLLFCHGTEHPDRNLRSSWLCYDAGITDVKRILALNACKIFDYEVICSLNNLPDEFFYELIQLHSGITLDEEMLEWEASEMTLSAPKPLTTVLDE